MIMEIGNEIGNCKSNKWDIIKLKFLLPRIILKKEQKRLNSKVFI